MSGNYKACKGCRRCDGQGCEHGCGQPTVAEPVIVGEDAYPDLTDEQWEGLIMLLPQNTQRRIVSRIQFGSAPVAEPPADAEVAQAERAVIGAAMAWFCARVNDDHHEYLFFNRACAGLLTAQDRQRLAAAKEQG